MTRARKISAILAILLAAATLAGAWPEAARAQAPAKAGVEVATVAAVVGGAELRRAGGGQWQLAAVGSALFVGDSVRTRPTSRMKLVFQDDSIVDVGPATELVIDRNLFDPDAGTHRSSLSIVAGKIRALVSEYYGAPGSRYEVETPTAVSGVRGTEFVVMYDEKAEYTDVVGVTGSVKVEGKLGVLGGGVQVGPQTATRVQKGRFPSAPRRIDDALFRQYLEGLDIFGTGGRDSLGKGHPAVSGVILSPSDRVEGKAVAEPAAAEGRGGLLIGAPGETLAQQLSPDVGTNTQPLIDYTVTPPGMSPGGGDTGTVHVGF